MSDNIVIDQKLTAVIDFDIVAFKIASACQGTYYEYQGTKYDYKSEVDSLLDADRIPKEDRDSLITKGNKPEPWNICKKSLVSYTEELINIFGDYKGYVSGSGNFRYKVATILPYKGNRPTERPHHLDDCKQFLVDTYGVEVTSYMEADDAIGLASKEDTITVSIDKDLNCIPGYHYNPDTKKFYEISTLEAFANFFSQLCTGDTSDNILGLYGVGPKSAMVKQIKNCSSMEEMKEIVTFEYNRRFGNYGPTFLTETAKLIWILQPTKNPIVDDDYWNG